MDTITKSVDWIIQFLETLADRTISTTYSKRLGQNYHALLRECVMVQKTFAVVKQRLTNLMDEWTFNRDQCRVALWPVVETDMQYSGRFTFWGAVKYLTFTIYRGVRIRGNGNKRRVFSACYKRAFRQVILAIENQYSATYRPSMDCFFMKLHDWKPALRQMMNLFMICRVAEELGMNVRSKPKRVMTGSLEEDLESDQRGIPASWNASPEERRWAAMEMARCTEEKVSFDGDNELNPNDDLHPDALKAMKDVFQVYGRSRMVKFKDPQLATDIRRIQLWDKDLRYICDLLKDFAPNNNEEFLKKNVGVGLKQYHKLLQEDDIRQNLERLNRRQSNKNRGRCWDTYVMNCVRDVKSMLEMPYIILGNEARLHFKMKLYKGVLLGDRSRFGVSGDPMGIQTDGTFECLQEGSDALEMASGRLVVIPEYKKGDNGPNSVWYHVWLGVNIDNMAHVFDDRVKIENAKVMAYEVGAIVFNLKSLEKTGKGMWNYYHMWWGGLVEELFLNNYPMLQKDATRFLKPKRNGKSTEEVIF